MKPYLMVSGDFVRTGGMDVANYWLARYIADRGHELHLVAHRIAGDLAQHQNVRFHRVVKPLGSSFLGEPLLDRAGRYWAGVVARRGGRILANGGNCTCQGSNWVHYVHAAYQPVVKGSAARRLKGFMERRLYLASERRALLTSKLILANSARTRSDVVARLAVQPDRVRIVYYGADPDAFHPHPRDEQERSRAMLGLSPGGPVVLFVGSMADDRKGFSSLLAAWNRLCADPAWDARLAVAGADSVTDAKLPDSLDGNSPPHPLPRIPPRHSASSRGLRSAGFTSPLRSLWAGRSRSLVQRRACICQRERGSRGALSGYPATPAAARSRRCRGHVQPASTLANMHRPVPRRDIGIRTATSLPHLGPCLCRDGRPDRGRRLKPLRILLACAQAPLPDGSAAGRWCYALIRGLVRRGHSVTALAACSDRAEAEAANDLFSGPGVQLNCFPALLRNRLASKLAALRRPFSYPFSPEMIARYRTECTRGYDVSHLDGTFGAYLTTPSDDSRTVLHVQNLYSIDWPEDRCENGQERILRSLALRAERKLIRSCRSVIAVTPQLARQISLIHPHASVCFVPLSLDPDRYVFIPKDKRPPHPVVSLIGSMDWFPSRSAAERLLQRLWPEIKRQRPDARLEITGRNARRALGDFLQLNDVDIQENVPSTQPYFERATILLYAPERGSGMKVKILEAFAMGVPVVTTSDGVEGLDTEDGVHACIADTDRNLIDRALRLMSDAAAQEKQRIAARRLSIPPTRPIRC